MQEDQARPFAIGGVVIWKEHAKLAIAVAFKLHCSKAGSLLNGGVGGFDVSVRSATPRSDEQRQQGKRKT
jgi:hypothetical protein